MPTYPPVLDAAAEAEAKWLTEVLLGRPDCDNFRKLEELRLIIRTVGITPRFRSPPATALDWANTMYEVLRTIDQDPEHPYGFTRYTARFLDVGSNPGGFTRYILEHTNARGVGISLPVASGGTGRAIPPSDRFELHEVDILDLVSRYRLSDPVPCALPFTFTRFDSIILDVSSSRPRTLVAQLLIAIHSICSGGQIFLTLSCIERPLTARILVAFRRIADHITTFKPLQDWNGQHTGRFYLHAQTVRFNTPYRQLRHNLQSLWNRIQSTDGSPDARDPSWDEQDLIAPWESVLKQSNVDWIVKLGNGGKLWETQLTALKRAFERIN